MSSPLLPSGRWPSTWPALWRPVRDRALFVGGTVLLTLLAIASLGDLGLSWWFASMPLVLLIGPLTRPGRVRRRFERAAAHDRLRMRRYGPGWQLSPRERRANVVAIVSDDGGLSYVDLRARVIGSRSSGGDFAPDWPG